MKCENFSQTGSLCDLWMGESGRIGGRRVMRGGRGKGGKGLRNAKY